MTLRNDKQQKNIFHVIDVDEHNRASVYFTLNTADKNVTSWNEEEAIGEHTWSFSVEKIMDEQEEPTMRASIRCNADCHDSLWIIKAKGSIDYKNRKKDSKWDKHRFERYFFNSSVLYMDLVDWDFKREKETEVLVFYIIVHEDCSKKETTMPLETNLKFQFSKNDGEIGEKIVMVNKFALAAISNYFRNLFFGNWAERSLQGKKKDNVEEENNAFTIREEADFDANIFSLMIYTPLAMGLIVEESGILDDNFGMALKILKYSFKYDLPIMQKFCEKFLKNYNLEHCPKMELLEVADSLGLCDLQERVLDSITPLDVGVNFGQNADIRARLNEQTRQELDKRLAKGSKRNQQGADESKTRDNKRRRCYFSSSSRSSSPPFGHPMSSSRSRTRSPPYGYPMRSYRSRSRSRSSTYSHQS